MTSDPPAESDGKITVDEYQLETMDRSNNELHYLEARQMLFPAEVFANAWSHRRQEVVEVHDDVHQRIEKSEKTGVSTGRKTNSRPYCHRK